MEAARSLFAEQGIDATSMDAIAASSGVSKATIYQHWRSKDALCLELMAELHGFDESLPDVDSGDLRTDLLAVMARHPPDEYAEVRTRILPHFMAYAASHADFGHAWRTRVLEPPRAQLMRALKRAIRRGELPAALNLDFAVGLLQGPPLYWFIRKQVVHDGPIGFDPELLVDAFLRSQGYVKAAAPQAATAAPRSRRAKR